MPTPSDITYRPLTPSLWPDLVRLFGPNGACAGCWCMWWRIPRGGKLWSDTRGPKAKRLLKQLVLKRKVNAVLAWVDDQPVGWCAFGPRKDFPRLDRVRAYQRGDTEKVWSIPCFFIRRDWRGKGVARGLLTFAVQLARKKGARIIEGYPVTLTRTGKRLPAAWSYTGPLSIFEAQGFKIIQRLSRSAPLVRKNL